MNLFQLPENQFKATDDVEAATRECRPKETLSLIRQSVSELQGKVTALQTEYAIKVLSVNASITTTIHLVMEIHPDKLVDVAIFINEAIDTVLSVNASIDNKLQTIWANISNVESEIAAIVTANEASTNHEEDVYNCSVLLIQRLNAAIEIFESVKAHTVIESEFKSLMNALKFEIENVITSIYDTADITINDLSLYLWNRITFLYNASYRDYNTHESALTGTYYYVRGYVRYNFSAYNNVEASFEKAYRILNEGLNVVIVMRLDIDNSIFNSILIGFRNKIKATQKYFNAYLDNLLGRAFNADAILRYEISNDLKRLNLTVYKVTCNSVVTFIEMNACFVKVENEYLNLSYKVVWLSNELNDLRHNTVDKGKLTYETKYVDLIKYRNELLEAQFASHNITVTDINDYATKRIALIYTDGYNKYTNDYYPSVESEAKILFARNDIFNLFASGVTSALQNRQNATQAFKDSLKVVIDKVNNVFKTNYDFIVGQSLQLSRYLYVDSLQSYKSTALNYKRSTPAGTCAVQLLIQTLEECALKKIDIFVGNKTNLDRGVESVVYSILASYRDYDVYLNASIYVNPAISYSLTLAPVNSSVYNGLKCFYDTDYGSYFMFGIDLVPETYEKCYNILIAS